MENSSYVFVPSDKEVWQLAQITSVNNRNGTIQVKSTNFVLEESKNPVYDAADCVKVVGLEAMESLPSDLVKLADVHKPGIFYTLQKRFMEDNIYTAIGPVLIVFNPFKWIPGLYDPELIEDYTSGKKNLSEDPHIFAIANTAFIGLQEGNSQSIIISGESGAGKTEATKQALFFLAALTTSKKRRSSNGDVDDKNEEPAAPAAAQPPKRGSLSGGGPLATMKHSSDSTGDIQNRILLASPILEAWGNAKTIRNNNSSRFGKFIEIWFAPNQEEIVKCVNTTYLLEKSRIVSQEGGERNYHIFYQFLKGCDEVENLGCKELAKNVSSCRFLNGGSCTVVKGVSDKDSYDETIASMVALGFSKRERESLFELLAAILCLGQIQFKLDSEDKAALTPESRKWLGRASHAFDINDDFFKKALLFKAITSGARKSVVFKGYDLESAHENLAAICKEVYYRCFQWIVAKVNVSINKRNDGNQSEDLDEGSGLIGVLDIFGFEIFVKNSLEQLCINLANETLQQHFNYNIFTGEMLLYEKEGIAVPTLDFSDNQDVLDLILQRPKGVFAILDEEANIPRGSDEGFLSKLVQAFAPDDAFAVKKLGGFSPNNNPRFVHRTRTRSFAIKHYAGEVNYTPAGFLTKNSDKISADALEVLKASNNALLTELFSWEGSHPTDKSAEKGNARGGMKANVKVTVTKRFSTQLDALIKQLNTTEPRYVRCIKPNDDKIALKTTPTLVYQQLTYSGVFEAVTIMQSGYPCRVSHAEFLSRFHILGLSFAAPGHSHAVANHRRGATTERMQLLSEGKTSYEEIFGKHKGRHLHSNASMKFERTATAEMCKRLLGVLVAEYGHDVFAACLVGHTRVFYRAEQIQKLESLRTDVVLQGVLFVQRFARGCLVRKFTKNILRDMSKCHEAIQNKNTELLHFVVHESDIIEQIDKLENNIVRGLEKSMRVTSKSVGDLDFEVNRRPLEIAETLLEVMSRHSRLSTEVANQLAAVEDETVSIYDIYDSLETNMNDLKDCNYFCENYPLPGKLLTFDWKDEPKIIVGDEIVYVCPEMELKVNKFGQIVKLKSRFDLFLSSINETELLNAIDDLSSLRATGDIDNKFCREEELISRKIIRRASDIYNCFARKMILSLDTDAMAIGDDAKADAISQGDAELASIQEDGYLEYRVSSKSVVKVYEEWDSHEYLHDKSAQTVELMELLNAIAHLRYLAEMGHWEPLWQALNHRTTSDAETNDSWLSLLDYDMKSRMKVFEREFLVISPIIKPYMEVTQKDLHSADSDSDEASVSENSDGTEESVSERPRGLSALFPREEPDFTEHERIQIEAEKKYRTEKRIVKYAVKRTRVVTKTRPKKVTVKEIIQVTEPHFTTQKVKKKVLKKKMVPSQADLEPPADLPPALPSMPAPPVPPAETPQKQTSSTTGKLAKKKIIQIFNLNLAAVFLDMESGDISWTCDCVPHPDGNIPQMFNQIAYMSHQNDADDANPDVRPEIYFEDINTGEVSWELPSMSEVAQSMAERISGTDLKGCEVMMNGTPYIHSASSELLLAIDDFVEYLADESQDHSKDNDVFSSELATADFPSPPPDEAGEWDIDSTATSSPSSPLPAAPIMVEVEYESEEEVEETVETLVTIDKEITKEVEETETYEVSEEFEDFEEKEEEVLVEVTPPPTPEPEPEPEPEKPKVVYKNPLLDKLNQEHQNYADFEPEIGTMDYAVLHISSMDGCIRVNQRLIPRLLERSLAEEIRAFVTTCLHFLQFREMKMTIDDCEKRLMDAVYENGVAEQMYATPKGLMLMLDNKFNVDLIESDAVALVYVTKLQELLEIAGNFESLFSSQQSDDYSQAKAFYQLLKALTDHASVEALNSTINAVHTFLESKSPLIMTAQAVLVYNQSKAALVKYLLEEGPTVYEESHAGEIEHTGAYTHRIFRPGFMEYSKISDVGLTEANKKFQDGIFIRDDKHSSIPIRIVYSYWDMFLQLSNCVTAIRGAMSEVDENKFHADAINILTDEEIEEFTSILSLIDAFKVHERWFRHFFPKKIESTRNMKKSAESAPPSDLTAESLTEADFYTTVLHESLLLNIAKQARVAWSMQQFVQFVLCELAQYQREIKHFIAIHRLSRALSEGAVTGTEGRLVVHSINFHSLEDALAQCTLDIIPTLKNRTLSKDAQILVELRKFVIVNDWTSIDAVLTPLLEVSGPKFYLKFHQNCRDEVELIAKELSDHMSKKLLNSSLGAGVMTIEKLPRNLIEGFDGKKIAKKGKKNKVASRIESPLLDDRILSISAAPSDEVFKKCLNDLKEAINFAERALYQSEEMKQLIFDAKISYALRDAVYHDRWEAPQSIELASSKLIDASNVNKDGDESSDSGSNRSNDSSMYTDESPSSDDDDDDDDKSVEETPQVRSAILSWGRTSTKQLAQLLQSQASTEEKVDGLRGLEEDDPLLKLLDWSLVDGVDNTREKSATPAPPPPPPPPELKAIPTSSLQQTETSVSLTTPSSPPAATASSKDSGGLTQTLTKINTAKLAKTTTEIAFEKLDMAERVRKCVEKLEQPLAHREGGKKETNRIIKLLESYYRQDGEAYSKKADVLYVSDILAYLAHMKQSASSNKLFGELRHRRKSNKILRRKRSVVLPESLDQKGDIDPVSAFQSDSVVQSFISSRREAWENNLDDDYDDGSDDDEDDDDDDDDDGVSNNNAASTDKDINSKEMSRNPISMLSFNSTSNDMTNREIQTVVNLAFERRARVMIWSSMNAGCITSVADIEKFRLGPSSRASLLAGVKAFDSPACSVGILEKSIDYVSELLMISADNTLGLTKKNAYKVGFSGQGDTYNDNFGKFFPKISTASKVWCDSLKILRDIRRHVCGLADMTKKLSIRGLSVAQITMVRNRMYAPFVEVSAVIREFNDIVSQNKIIHALDHGGPVYSPTGKLKTDASSLNVSELTACVEENSKKMSLLVNEISNPSSIEAAERQYKISLRTDNESEYSDITERLLDEAKAKSLAEVDAFKAHSTNQATIASATFDAAESRHHNQPSSHKHKVKRDKHVYKSLKLERLCSFAEISLKLREALIQGRWGKTQQNGVSGPTLGDLCTEYHSMLEKFARDDKLLALVATERGESVPRNVPTPTILTAEITTVNHELKKYDLLGEFPNAFRSGCIGGSPLKLQLCNVNFDELGRIVTKTENWHHEKALLAIPDKQKMVMDVDIEKYYLAAKECISYRKELRRIYDSFRRTDPAVAHHHKTAQDILAHSSFLDQSLSKAIESVTYLFTSLEETNASSNSKTPAPDNSKPLAHENQSLRDRLRRNADHAEDKAASAYIIHMWDNLSHFLQKSRYLDSVPALQHELSLLREDQISREYIQDTVKIIHKYDHYMKHQSEDAGVNDTKYPKIVNGAINYAIFGAIGDIHSSVEVIRSLCKNNEKLNREFADLNKKSNRLLKHNPKVESVLQTSALLIHLLRAQVLTHFKIEMDNAVGKFDHNVHFLSHRSEVTAFSEAKAGSGDDSDEDLHTNVVGKSSHRGKSRKSKIIALNKKLHALRKLLVSVEEPVHRQWVNAHPNAAQEGTEVYENETPSIAALVHSAADTKLSNDLSTMLSIATAGLRLQKTGSLEVTDATYASSDSEDDPEDVEDLHFDDDDLFPVENTDNKTLLTQSYASLLLKKQSDMVVEQRRRVFSVQGILRTFIRHTGEFQDKDDMFSTLTGNTVMAAARTSGEERYVHPTVRNQFSHAIMDCYDEVHQLDLKEALRNEEGKTKGEPGKLDISSISSAPLRQVLDKLQDHATAVHATSLHKGKLRKFAKMARMLPLSVVRIRMKQGGFSDEDINSFLMEMMLLEHDHGSTDLRGNTGLVNDLDRSVGSGINNPRLVRTAEKSLLIRSCEILAQMREIVVSRDYEAGFEILEMFISPVKASASNTTTAAVAASSFYSVVHEQARSEFEILTMDICTGFWSTIQGTNLAPGIYLRIYTSLLMLSEQSPAMHKLCKQSIELIDKSSHTIQPSSPKQHHHHSHHHGSHESKDLGNDMNSNKPKQLPPLDELPEELQPFTLAQLEARQIAGEVDWELQISARSEPKYNPEKYIMQQDNFSQTDGTAILDIVDPMYHKMHGELVASREEAQNKLGFMRAERDRRLKILALREADATSRVEKEEKDALQTIIKLWENDAAVVDAKRASLEKDKNNAQQRNITSKKIERNVRKLDRARMKQLHAVAKALSVHHQVIIDKRKDLAYSKMRMDLNMRKLHTIQEQIKGVSLNIKAEQEIVDAYLLRSEKRERKAAERARKSKEQLR